MATIQEILNKTLQKESGLTNTTGSVYNTGFNQSSIPLNSTSIPTKTNLFQGYTSGTGMKISPITFSIEQ